MDRDEQGDWMVWLAGAGLWVIWVWKQGGLEAHRMGKAGRAGWQGRVRSKEKFGAGREWQLGEWRLEVQGGLGGWALAVTQG